MSIVKNEKFCKKLINKALLPLGTSYEKIFENHPDGYIGKKLWCNYYSFQSAEGFAEYQAWALNELSILYAGNQQKALEAWNEFDIALGLKQDYLWNNKALENKL